MCTQMKLIECFDIPTAESVSLYFIKIAGCNPRFLRKSAVCIPQFFRINGRYGATPIIGEMERVFEKNR